MTRWLGVLWAVPFLAFGQGTCPVRHLAVFEANLAEFHEERTLDLQAGLNNVEWRSLMPLAVLSTVRVTGDQVTVTRQEITMDGPEVHNQKSPVLHLTLQTTAAGPRKVQVDYLAPKLGWRADYSLVLGPPAQGGRPAEMTLDGWVSVRNETGMDVCAGSVDLVAGEVQLLAEGGSSPRVFTANSQIAQFGNADEAQPEGAAISGLSVFSRISLGSNLAIAANTSIGRFPLFQHLKLAVEQRNVFENEATAQTLGRGGFMLAPRGLEVRLVSRNSSKELFPSGTVTVYSQEGGIPQVVGQDRIPITPVGADFSVTQGRSNVLQGTRRVIDRHDEADPDARNRRKLITQVEVVLTNRSAEEVPAFVREGVEHYRSGQWTVTESSHRHQRLAEDLMEFRVSVPAKGSVKVTYTVETR